MRPHLRTIPAVIVVALLAASAPTVAAAQSEQDVADAARRVHQAEVRAAEARSVFGNRSDALLAAFDDYQRLTAEFTAASSSLASLRDQIRDREAELRGLTADTRRLVIGAYAAASTGELGPLLELESFEQIAIVSDLLARSAVHQAGTVSRFEASRAELTGERLALERAESDAIRLRHEAEALVADIQVLVDEAATGFRSAQRAAGQARAEYGTAVAELEAAKNSVTPRSYAWRGLIERYFPDDLLWEALQVLDCESRGDPDATNPTSGAAGLFQFLEGTWLVASTFSGFPGASPYDPEANVASAAWLVRHSELIDHPRGTWGHWECQPLTDTPASADG